MRFGAVCRRLAERLWQDGLKVENGGDSEWFVAGGGCSHWQDNTVCGEGQKVRYKLMEQAESSEAKPRPAITGEAQKSLTFGPADRTDLEDQWK